MSVGERCHPSLPWACTQMNEVIPGEKSPANQRCAAVSLSQVEFALLRPPLSEEGSKRAEEKNRFCEQAAVCSGLTGGNTQDRREGINVRKLILPFHQAAHSSAVYPCCPEGRRLTWLRTPVLSAGTYLLRIKVDAGVWVWRTRRFASSPGFYITSDISLPTSAEIIWFKQFFPNQSVWPVKYKCILSSVASSCKCKK